MSISDGRNFRRSFYGYNRNAVDAEFNRLIDQNERLDEDRHSLQAQIDLISSERSALSHEQLRLNSDLRYMSGQVTELEKSLSQAKGDKDTLERQIDAHKAETNALQFRVDHLKERDRDFALREREFTELQSSVSSIMSVTKRASDRLFQKVVENQESITRIAGDAAREVAYIRADMNQVRQQLNAALDEVQDRIDRVDASLTGAVQKLVAIKHDDGLRVGESSPDIVDEVERLLSLRAGDVDNSGDKAYSVPVLGPYSAKLISDTAHRVSEGKITPKPDGELGVKRVNPTAFESSDDSISEARRLLDNGGEAPDDFFSNDQYFPSFSDEPESVNTPHSEPEPEYDDGGAIPLGPVSAPPPQPMQIGFTPYSNTSYPSAMTGNVYYSGAQMASPASYERYPVRTYSYDPAQAYRQSKNSKPEERASVQQSKEKSTVKVTPRKTKVHPTKRGSAVKAR